MSSGDDYTRKQSARDAEYEREYKAWIGSLPADQRPGRYTAGRKSAFDPVAFKTVIEANGGTLTRSNINQVAATMKCSVRTA